MKVIFLDIDGVLNTESGLKQLTNNWKDMDKAYDTEGRNMFCPKAVSVLKEIISATGAKIVVSSTWRASGIEFLRKLWTDRNLPGEIIDITGFSKDRIRGKEVRDWLTKRDYYHSSMCDSPYFKKLRSNSEITGYCIIDDDIDFLIEQYDHFINTDPMTGLAEEGMLKKCIDALNIIS